jgi:ABC-2 type transport system permease protein
VSLPAYTLAKCVARAVIVIGVTLAVSLASFLVVGVEFSAPGAAVDVMGWLLVVMLYACLWFAIGLLVNSFSLKSETNGVLLANIWLTAVVVLPALVNVLATAAYPAPSRVTLTTELREAATEAEQQAAEAREAYFFDHPELGDEQAPGAFFREVLASEMAIESRIDPLLDDFERQSRDRAGVVNALQYLSPAIVAQQALTAQAGTDEARYERFRQQVREFHSVYRSFFADRMLADQIMNATDVEAIPVFRFEETHGRWPVAAIAALLVITLLLAALSLRRYRSYPVLQAT